MSEYFLGLLSGTSMDAIDAALVDFSDNNVRLIATHSQKFPHDLKKECETLIRNKSTTLLDFGKLNTQLGHLFADTANQLISNANVKKENILAIGSHGQTIFHHPNDKNPFSLQMGDGNIIASSTGIQTVADFRSKDIALGGQGAPLTPAFHNVLFRDTTQNRAAVNIGGIANITYLPADQNQSIIGFDSGPGNTLLDLWTEKHLKKSYDKNGNWAKTGKISIELLTNMLKDNFFTLALPKSTGREYFNLPWLEHYLSDEITPEDVQATLVELTATTIVNHIKEFSSNADDIILCGGGTHNEYLVQRIKELAGTISVSSSEQFGYHPDWIEAMTFAWLAKQNIEQKPGNLPSVTGASRSAILGSIYFA